MESKKSSPTIPPKEMSSVNGDVVNESSDHRVNVLGDKLTSKGCTSEETPSENALLRSRIDEQSQLIMILKQRSDEAIQTAHSLEKSNALLAAKSKQAHDDLALKMRMCDKLESRFNDLASNHQQMIDFKDEYKRRNAELEEDNEQLRSENVQLFSATINEQECRIEELQSSENDLKQQVSSFDAKCRSLQQQIAELKQQHQIQLEARDNRLTQTELQLAGVKQQLDQLQFSSSQASTHAQTVIERLLKEKEDYVELMLSRDRVIQEKQAENKRLQQRADSLEKTVKDLKTKLDRDRSAAAASVNSELLRLRKCVTDTQAKYDSLTQEYMMYKKHIQSLLQQERELNEKLRHLVI